MAEAASGPRTPAFWETRWFVVGVALAAAIPLLLPAIPPMVDLPGHMARYRVELDQANPHFRAWYDFTWSLIGNLGIDLLIIPMAKIFGLELGTKLIVMAIPVLTVSGLLWIAREVHGRVPPTAYFAVPFAYSFPFHFGFVNFALSMALALNLFALWLRMARLGRVRLRAIIFVPLSILLWVCHTYGWGTLGVLAFSAELIRQHDRGRNWFLAAVHAGIACLVLAVPMLLMALWRSGDHVGGITGDFFNWWLKWRWAVMMLRDRWRWFDEASLLMLSALLVVALRHPHIEYSRNLSLSALFLLAMYLILPRIVFGSAYADMRLAPFVMALAIIALRSRPRLTRRNATLIALTAIGFAAVRLIANTASFAIYDQGYQRQLAALDHLPRGARLLSFVGATCGWPWAMTRYEHLPGIALVRRGAFTNDQWSMAGAQLLTVHYDAAPAFSHDPSEIVTPVQCWRESWRPINKALATFPRDAFDYVWLIQPPRYDARLVQGLVPVWRSGSSVLFRVDHDVAAPAVPGITPGVPPSAPTTPPAPTPRA